MRCHYWIFNTRNIRETIDSFARGPYYHLFKRYVFILLTKMRTETKTVPSTWYIFNFQGCTHKFFHVPYIIIGLVHEEQTNFYREKRRVAFMTGHLFTFLVVLSLICLETTQILICGNQTIWRLKILVRTIVAALLKTKDIKKRERNISQWCKWSWKIRVTNILLPEQYLMPDYAHLAHPSPHKHIHTNKKDTVCLIIVNRGDYTLMLDMLYSNISVVCTYHFRGVFKTIFWCDCCSICWKKKLLKALNFHFYVHKAPSKVEE